MTDFFQLLVFMLAAVNPAAAAAGPTPPGRSLSPRTVALGLVIAIIVVGAAALLAHPILDGLGVEPETFRVGAGVILLVGGALAVWNGGASHRGPWEGRSVAVFPLALPLFATPAALAAAISYGADRGEGETLLAGALAVAVAGVLVGLRAGRFEAASDAVARITGAVLVVVAAGLVVSGVRAI